MTNILIRKLDDHEILIISMSADYMNFEKDRKIPINIPLIKLDDLCIVMKF